MPEPLNPVVVPREALDALTEWVENFAAPEADELVRAVLDQAQEVERSWFIKPARLPDNDEAWESFIVDPMSAAEEGSVQHWAEVDR